MLSRNVNLTAVRPSELERERKRVAASVHADDFDKLLYQSLGIRGANTHRKVYLRMQLNPRENTYSQAATKCINSWVYPGNEGSIVDLCISLL